MSYEKITRIDTGAYSSVFKVKKCNTGEIFAMKKFTVKEDGCSIDMLREISLLKITDHPNIGKLLEYNIFKRYIILPLYESTLLNVIRHRKTDMMDLYQTIINNMSPVIRGLFEGVYHLHSLGICHRDLKPSNLMVTMDKNNNIPKIVIIDMGQSKRLDWNRRDGARTRSVCTLWYRAPEILLGDDRYSFGMDIWSAGCIIYEIVMAYPLFPGDSSVDQLFQIFKVLGTPTDEDWEGVTKLPEYKSLFPKFKPKTNIIEDIHRIDNDLKDLISKLLVMNPKGRLTCSEALSHRYLSNYDNDNNNNILPSPDKYKDYILNIPYEGFSLSDQLEITNMMRKVLLDWLLVVCIECRDMGELGLRAYFRTVGIVDRICNKFAIKRTHYQLLGITALWIASKIEEIYVPDLEFMEYICDNIYSMDTIEKMETKILAMLNMDIYFPIHIDYVPYHYTPPTNKDEISEIEFLIIYSTFSKDLMQYHPNTLCQSVCNRVTKIKPETQTKCDSDMDKWLKQSVRKNVKVDMKDDNAPDSLGIEDMYSKCSFYEKYI
jgi:cyclin-dependent kinase 2